jgi:alkyl sulfatase BDS1-like metallo-beta-lactamase superfamily hydrolase
VTINEIHNVYEVPKKPAQQWAVRSYHGDVQNNVARRDQPLPRPLRRQPDQPDPAVAEGLGAAVRRDDGRLAEDHRQGPGVDRTGQVPARTEILDRLVFAEPQNQDARRLLADAFEQLGYQAESTSVRNTFLQGAFELRNGLPGGVPPRSTGPDVVRAMSTEQWLDFVGISMDPKKAEGIGSSSISSRPTTASSSSSR